MTKRLSLTILTLFILVGIGVSIYFYLFANSPAITVDTGAIDFPVAGKGTDGAGTDASASPATAPTPVSITGRLVQISAGPVVPGVSVVSLTATNASSSPEISVSYIERGSGNIFSYLSRAKTLTRINNKTIPGIQSAVWLPDASTAFVRYLSGNTSSTINTYALAATSSTGSFLSQDISGIAASSAGILTLVSGVSGSVISLGHIDGTRFSALFTTPLTSLRVSFAGKNQYLLFSKPSAKLPGNAFIVDSVGNFSRIAGPKNGLVALASPSGKWVLVSYVQGNTMQMELIATATGASVPLPIATIADKCAWSSNDETIYCGVPVSPDSSLMYPDDWYQGAVSFTDRIWKIQVAGRYAQLVLDFSAADKGPLDAESLAVDATNTILVFMNKNDGSLWSYAL